MGLRCSLLGHDWSETEIEDERDEQGNEVVMTVREYEVCARCGEKSLISENTEVTSVSNGQSAAAGDEAVGEDAAATGDVEAPEDAADDDDADAVAAEVVAEATADDEDEVADEPTEPAVDAEDDDAEFIGGDDEDEVADDITEPAVDAETPAEDAATVDSDDDAMILGGDDDDGEAAEPADAPDAEPDDAVADADVVTEAEASDPHADPETDDGVILPGDEPEEPEESEREHGEWPEHETRHGEQATEEREWPDHGGEDDGYDATAPDGEAADVEFEGGHPEADAQEPEKGHDAEFIDNASARSAEQESDQRARNAASGSPTGIASASEAQAPGTGSPSRGGGDLVCPACGNTELASRTSLRAGDICPECKRGYLAEE
ncbi:DUF7093 family protein [Haloarchaeobius amylolyticus]|uniref:DUF7093 family protein n=1 Tax=Haloarchaeobius amylolyticus TaxID=1198296 RepID=UPI00226DE9E8|nr:hypothetical protein [Haloarchaeobius amylolyticus]